MREYIYVVTATESMSVVRTWVYREEDHAIGRYLSVLEVWFPEVEPKNIEVYEQYMVSEQAIEDGIEGLVQLEKRMLR